MKLKIQPFQDPLTSAEHKFSEVFEDKEPEHDFTIVVRRSGHGLIRRETLSRIRSGELKTKQIQEIAEKYGGEDGELDVENLSDEQMVELATMDAANAWIAPLLVEDLIGLRVEGEDDLVTLSDRPDDFAETVDWLLTEYPELSVALSSWAHDAEKRYQTYIKSAKKDSASTSTRKRNARPKPSASGKPPAESSTSSSDPQSAQAS